MESQKDSRASNIFVALATLIAGAALVYYVLHSNGWHYGGDLNAFWQKMSKGQRLAMLAGFIASAYGFGGVINRIFGRPAQA